MDIYHGEKWRIRYITCRYFTRSYPDIDLHFIVWTSSSSQETAMGWTPMFLSHVNVFCDLLLNTLGIPKHGISLFYLVTKQNVVNCDISMHLSFNVCVIQPIILITMKILYRNKLEKWRKVTTISCFWSRFLWALNNFWITSTSWSMKTSQITRWKNKHQFDLNYDSVVVPKYMY